MFTSSFRSRVVEPFRPRQKSIFEFLVVQEGPVQKITLIDQKEADFWRRKLKEDQEKGSHEEGVKLALIDNISGAIVITGHN